MKRVKVIPKIVIVKEMNDEESVDEFVLEIRIRIIQAIKGFPIEFKEMEVEVDQYANPS